MSEPILTISDLRVRYGHVDAVNGISFDLCRGDVLALLGPNGAGKTSTLQAISGLIPFTGRINFKGRDVGTCQPEALARRGLIQVPEGRRIFPTLTVHENLHVAQIARSGRKAASISDVYELFPALGRLKDRGGWTLSGGEQQMLAIGRGLVGGPEALLLDEPSLGLAPIIVGAVFEALCQIGQLVPLVIVEQNTAVALTACTKVVVIAEGHQVLAGSPDDIRQSAALLDTYLGTSDLHSD